MQCFKKNLVWKVLLFLRDIVKMKINFLGDKCCTHSLLTFAGLDVTEAIHQVSFQNVVTPWTISPRADKGADPVLLTHPTWPWAGTPGPPLCPRTVPLDTVSPNTNFISIWEFMKKKEKKNSNLSIQLRKKFTDCRWAVGKTLSHCNGTFNQNNNQNTASYFIDRS